MPWAKRGGRGGGVRQVDELPEPIDGVGNIYYVKADYLGPTTWESSDFDLTLTPADVSGANSGTSLGYAPPRHDQVEGWQRYLQGR